MEEIIKKLNDLKILQKSIDWREDIGEEELNNILGTKLDIIASGLNIDKHRWYEIATDVISVNGDYIGVDYVADLFSDGMSVDDVFHTLKFFPMKQVKSVTYIKQ